MRPCMVIVKLDRTFGIDWLELHLVSLSPAHRSEHEYRRAIRYWRAQAVEKPNVFPIHEEVDVASHVSPLVHDPVECSRRFPAERSERIADGLARLMEHQRRILLRIRAKDVRQLDGYQAAPAVPVF